MIVVTGANGFIGSAVVWELNKAGHKDIVCVDSVTPEDRPEPLHNRTYSTFLGKDDVWEFLLNRENLAKITAVIHLGACSATTEMNVAFLTENNLEYTRQIWSWCTRYQKPLLYASSGAVYGDGSHGFDDATPSNTFEPLNPYGASKLNFDIWVEQQIQEKCPTPPMWFGLRFFNVFGPNEYHKEFMRSVAHKAYYQILETGALTLFRSRNAQYKDGEQMRDFVYVKDITRWIVELMNLPAEKGATHSGIYNMGFGQARTWLNLADAVFRSMKRERHITWIDIPETMGPRYQYFTEAKMARLMSLGLSKPQWPLELAIDDYIGKYLARASMENSLESYL